MSDDALSRQEVEKLLQPGGKTEGGRGDNRVRVLAYDFKRPERIGKDQMRAMQSLHESLARSLGAALSALLRSMIEVRLISVDQLTYSEFIYSLEVPTCYNLLKCKPLEGHWLLDLSPSLLYPIIDRMLGGTVNKSSTLRRPLSEIELRLATRITNLFLRELQHLWNNVIELQIEIERVESNPQLVQIVPPNEVVIMVSFEVAMGSVRGMTNLCIPYNTIERVGSKLTNNSWIGYAPGRPDRETTQQISDQLQGSQVELVVTLARSSIATGELFDLQVGDIISTDKDIHSPLEVEIAEVVKFISSPGTIKGRKAVKIESILSSPTAAVAEQPHTEAPAPAPA